MPSRAGRRPEHPTSDSPQLTAAGRVLAVLEAFAPEHPSLSLTEISRRSGLTMPTTHRLVGELRSWGALERDAQGRYAVGIRLLELTALAPRGLQLRELAQPYLDDLHHATRANVHLAVRDGNEAVYIESLRARGGAEVLSRLGGRWPLHATGTGQVLLAHASADDQEEVLSSPLTRFTEHTIVDPQVLRGFLADVRNLGVAIAESHITPGVMAVAAPIRGDRDDVVAALGLTVNQQGTNAHSLVPVLNATTRGISRALGAPSTMPRRDTTRRGLVPPQRRPPRGAG
ncbi:DNA-binding IclR family transcriptional regulator [Lipingzhangella halophila]|uniref:DNA-binding IclR family transcriptional regulator n=1 Tax=Lipingzhangella halophila TaxID=1783352 RepID=A0A7W7RFV5_9ACTN|nr:IclR family transcriptional regulator [Lipingzhangella halophila]MBB4931204.1 DNA-binding IclR family transcriptional regulator [Lipingzhangella halophila]